MQKVIVLQARMNSSRLPGKVMLPLAGKPLLWHILERLKHAGTADRICVATTVEESDNEIEKFCISQGVAVVRGSENDVLSRYIQAAFAMNAGVVVRATADNPLVHPEGVDAELDYLESHPDCDYASMKKLPLGTMVESFTLRTLEKLDYIAKDEIYREHVTFYLHDRRGMHGFNMADLPVETGLAKPELRLTVDTREDYELMSRIYDALYNEGEIIDLRDVVRFVSSNPELANLNRGVIQVPTLQILESVLS